ncbi:acyl-CoA dehydrogenase family protein [Rhodococcus sp. DMU1]|uniref:acyl-CoA dehydrogenase family protein n=1 Tax=Rhodococcus sp. DMU1 TaxID=2722825 RepID=UPI00143E7295|nr:acyl-CoA dehydrogenase family protein [Rhodococcus sp. DMU1]QIX53779.1 hypothetical protein HFP48_29715 [Rhodococcus sp. DMU1]
MESTIDSAALTERDRADLLESLTAESLSALMRSTRTWDDRALRRRLSVLLVQLEAVRQLRSGDVACQPMVIEAAELRGLAEAGEFVAELLGPGLLVEVGNPLRVALRRLVQATGTLTAQADRALESVAIDVAGHVIERNEALTTVVSEEDWQRDAFGDLAAGLAQVAYSAGYTLSGTDYFSAAGLGAQALAVAGVPTDADPEMRRSTLAAVERTGSWDPVMVRTHAKVVDGSWRINGEKWYVPGAEAADTILVIARTVGGPSLYRVARQAPGVTIEPLDSLYKPRALSRITFANASAVLIGEVGAGGRIMNGTVDKAATVLAGEQMGVMDRALRCLSEIPPSCRDNEAWRRYTREIADLEMLRAGATALWYRAVRTQGSDDVGSGAVAAALAHIGCSHALRTAALRLVSIAEVDSDTAESIRVRARETDLLLGGPAVAHERLLERLGI